MKNILIPIQLCRVSTREVSIVCTSQLPHLSFTEAYTMLASNFVKIYHLVSNVSSIKRPATLQVADIHTSFTWKMNFKYLKMTDNILQAVYYVEIGLFVVIIIYNLYTKKFMSVPCMNPDMRTIQYVRSFQSVTLRRQKHIKHCHTYLLMVFFGLLFTFCFRCTPRTLSYTRHKTLQNCQKENKYEVISYDTICF